ncbi:MAG: hypothetical protein Hals2KO_12570 [Halioglobus sp.]
MSTSLLKRRRFLLGLGAGAGTLAMAGCGSDPAPGRYTEADIALLAQQREREAATAGKGPYGPQVYRGYRGLAELPWFELDASGRLRCNDETVPQAIDVHCHLGMSVLFEPRLDLQARTPRVRHLLDCDAEEPGCRLDLDVYANNNFTEDALGDLSRSTVAQALWGSAFAETQTIPNLLDEMDAMRVQQAIILPIKMGLPFGDRQTERWRDAIDEAGVDDRLISGLSIFPRGKTRIEEMRAHASTGARLMKIHPTVQAFYPDDPDMMEVYEEAQRLGLVIFYHGGRAGIEPESRHRYAVPRHYEAVLANFPQLQVILGHAGARDGEAMLELALRYDNAWLGIHGQGVTRLEEMIQRTGGERLLFGTDWPFYHLGMSLAKVLICTDTPGRLELRKRILRDNALTLFPELSAVG